MSAAEVATLRIERVDVVYRPDAAIAWGKQRAEYAERAADKPAKPGEARRNAYMNEEQRQEERTRVYDGAIDSKEAYEYERSKLTAMVKDKLERSIVPKLKGNRPVVLEVQVASFVIPSAVQRVLIGGNPTFGAVTVLKDSRTGAELAKQDPVIQAYAGQGLLGTLVEQGFGPLEDRVLDAYVGQVDNWLLKKSGT
jgi:hypothetical protein